MLYIYAETYMKDFQAAGEAFVSPTKHPELEISSLSFCATIRPLVFSSTL
jgi:hypothetical protein